MKKKHGAGADHALEMLNVFASVGVRLFDITHTNIDADKRGFRPIKISPLQAISSRPRASNPA